MEHPLHLHQPTNGTTEFVVWKITEMTSKLFGRWVTRSQRSHAPPSQSNSKAPKFDGNHTSGCSDKGGVCARRAKIRHTSLRTGAPPPHTRIDAHWTPAEVSWDNSPQATAQARGGSRGWQVTRFVLPCALPPPYPRLRGLSAQDVAHLKTLLAQKDAGPLPEPLRCLRIPP